MGETSIQKGEGRLLPISRNSVGKISLRAGGRDAISSHLHGPWAVERSKTEGGCGLVECDFDNFLTVMFWEKDPV